MLRNALSCWLVDSRIGATIDRFPVGDRETHSMRLEGIRRLVRVTWVAFSWVISSWSIFLCSLLVYIRLNYILFICIPLVNIRSTFFFIPLKCILLERIRLGEPEDPSDCFRKVAPDRGSRALPFYRLPWKKMANVLTLNFRTFENRSQRVRHS